MARTAKTALTGRQVRLAQQARNELTQYLRADGTIDLPRALAEGRGHLISRVRRGPSGYLHVEWHDAQAALVLIGRHHGLFTDRVETSASVNITAEDVAEAERLLTEYRLERDAAGEAEQRRRAEEQQGGHS